MRRQAIRAASQVVEAISEGCGKRTNREFGRYLDIAIGSTTELQSQIVLSVKHGIVKRDIAAPLYREAEEIRRMLYAFKRWIDGKDDREKPAGS